MRGARPLEGLRIIELSALVAPPLGGMTLAELGAEVIRIDPPGGGVDIARWPLAPWGASLFWAGLNQGKRSVTIDYRRHEGRALVRRLVCCGGQGGALALTNLPMSGALSYDALCEGRPDLILVGIQGDRHGGTAVDYTVICRTGLPGITGPAGTRDQVNHVLPAWDLCTGYLAAISVLAAERRRRLTGEGSHVRLNLEDVALATMSHLCYLAEAELGSVQERQGNDLFGAFGRDFETADAERVMVVGLTGRQWRSLCAATAIGPAVTEMGHRLGLELDREGDRYVARNAIAALIEPWVASRPLQEVAEVFDHHGVCWGRYQSVSSLVRNDPSCSEQNPMFRRIEQPGIGPVLGSASPMTFYGRREPPVPAPRLGEHTAAVLSTLLGIEPAKIQELTPQGVIGSPAMA